MADKQRTAASIPCSSSSHVVAREMAAAGLACALANGSLHGLETTKVKLQLHPNPSWQVVREIVQKEGILRGLLFPGLTTSITRSLLYGSFRVGLYPMIRDTVAAASDPNNIGQAVLNRLFSGMLTGGIGSLLTCPLDVVRTRLQADAGVICPTTRTYATGLRKGLPVRYEGMRDALIKILSEEGLRSGLYRGSTVTITRAVFLNGSQLASYDTLKRMWAVPWGQTKDGEETMMLHVVSAFCSGIIAQTAVMPIDTIKASRMMGEHWSAILGKVRKHGPMFLYRGYLPACTGQGIIMVLQMPLVELFRQLFGVGTI